MSDLCVIFRDCQFVHSICMCYAHSACNAQSKYGQRGHGTIFIILMHLVCGPCLAAAEREEVNNTAVEQFIDAEGQLALEEEQLADALAVNDISITALRSHPACIACPCLGCVIGICSEIKQHLCRSGYEN